MANIKGCLLHNNDDWRTPSDLYNAFINKGYFDPCPYLSKVDNLSILFKDKKKIYINPPFSQLDKWCDFIIKHLHYVHCICLLMPVRTDTQYFNKIFPYITDIYFIRGRLHFNDSKQSAPFPTMLCCFGFSGNVVKSHVVSLNELITLIDCWGWCIGSSLTDTYK